MKLINKLTTIMIYGAMVPVIALGTSALAQNHVNSDTSDKNSATKVGTDQNFSGAMFMNIRPMGALYADDIIGKPIRHRASNEEVGTIEELVIGTDGQIVGVEVKSGGFLGMGGQEVSLSWQHLQHSMEDDESVFYTSIDEKTLRTAPKFDRK